MTKFANRTQWELTQNQFSKTLERIKASEVSLFDLTITNPTALEFSYPLDKILRPLYSKENFLYYFDKQKFEQELNNKFYPYILVQDKKDLKFSNLENKQIVKISNNHLQYAVTWFVLAIGIIIAFWFYKRK